MYVFELGYSAGGALIRLVNSLVVHRQGETPFFSVCSRNYIQRPLRFIWSFYAPTASSVPGTTAGITHSTLLSAFTSKCYKRQANLRVGPIQGGYGRDLKHKSLSKRNIETCDKPTPRLSKDSKAEGEEVPT